MKISPDDSTTHRPRALAPEAFRAQCTGIGQTQRASRMTGAMRAMRVADSMTPECRALVPDSEGYPPPLPALGLLP